MVVTQSEELAAGDEHPGAELGSVQHGVGAEADELRLRVGEDGELAAGEPGLGVLLEVDGDPVEAGDGAQQRPGVQIVGEEASGRGEDAGSDVAGGELPQLAGQYGHGERRQVGAEQGYPVALQQGAQGVEAPQDGGGGGRGAHDDDMAVRLDDGLEFGQHVVERAGVDVAQHDGRQGAFVVRAAPCRRRSRQWQLARAAPRSPHARRPTGCYSGAPS